MPSILFPVFNPREICLFGQQELLATVIEPLAHSGNNLAPHTNHAAWGKKNLSMEYCLCKHVRNGAPRLLQQTGQE